MKITFEVSNETITELIYTYVCSKLGPGAVVDKESVKIEVQSKQNYREHTWENGQLRVRYEGEI